MIQGLKNGTYKKIVVLTGAGISVSAGIPDFRSPGSGIYANLQKYNLKRPEDLFTISYFLEKPEVFYEFAKEFDLDSFDATPTHFFIRLLQDKSLLSMNITQNIDNLEAKASIQDDFLCQAHGSLRNAFCAKCKKEMDFLTFKEHVKAGAIYRCNAAGCGGPVKPEIVFFGESLPKSFFKSMKAVEECDLMLVMGTALAVSPFNQLPFFTSQGVHQILINRENTNATSAHDFEKGNYRLFVPGNCDDTIRKIVSDCGWEEEFEKVLPEKHRGKAQKAGAGAAAAKED
ncbi:hypothetical protein FGO68_gene12405 [Halteria grandinella]|uniref:Deacetylase sirtuin-type domain-containing protein n=1 Tax=Halteria grandinella TaxID=5974 RepID=A0A8J8T180_HALGN|nr:hypothetical protein FGO68_gene12405 [Halteria grandinella]